MASARPEEEPIESDFEIDDEIKDSLNSLLNIPLEFEDSTDDETAKDDKPPEKTRGDSVERQLEALFVGNQEDPGGGGRSKDMGLESISENELDGPESGECDTSDGELPDSPSIVVSLPGESPVLPSKSSKIDNVSQNGDSDVEVLDEYTNITKGCFEHANDKKVNKPNRRVLIENINPPDTLSHSHKEKKAKDYNKTKAKTKEKKGKSKKKNEISNGEKRELKFKKYLQRIDQYRAKCIEYMMELSKVNIDEKDHLKLDHDKKSGKGERHKLKSIVEKVNNLKERNSSPQSSTSSRLDKSSNCSRVDKESRGSYKSYSPTKNKSSASDKKSKSKSKEEKEHKIKYQKYMAYLQAEREKCYEYEARLALDSPKIKSSRKHKKSSTKSPDKLKLKKDCLDVKETQLPVLSFLEFCSSRELNTPDIEIPKPLPVPCENKCDVRTDRTVSVDSVATTSTMPSDSVDEDNELFVTYSDLVQLDKMRATQKQGKKKDIVGENEEKDTEMKSISVFSSVLFKGSVDSNDIPFLQETRPPSPKPSDTFKPKTNFTESTEPDELYDWNDDLSVISQSSLSPSRSPAPKVHNKALLNFLENQKQRIENKKLRKDKKSTKVSRSRSRSPKKDKLKKRKLKHHSSTSISISPSPPPPKVRSPEVYKSRPSPPAHLKERWRDYPSPTDRRREQYERRSRINRRSRSRTRVRVGHRSRSSSEERHYRRYRSRSRSRSRTPRSRSRTPRSRSRTRSRSRSKTRTPPVVMVQLSTAEKRRKLKEEHERALASLRATLRKPKPQAPMTITYRPDGDNYDPVVMNEDSSSDSPADVSDLPEPALPPLPPGLPPEPPPAPPAAPPAPAAAPAKDKAEDIAVSTYTPFVPVPNTPHSIHPPHQPVSYMNADIHQMPPYNNWMAPGMPMSDMGPGMQHHMYPPPQMMNNYDQFNGPSQQAFPYMNQPPPPLPYQMQMPPCHQHYRMPTPVPPPNINLISVRQEIKNINSNPVIIPPGLDHSNNDVRTRGNSLTHAIDINSKCKHNPLGQNNQTVQEAIDTVKKCLMNCDVIKNKDPRLAPAESRKISSDTLITTQNISEDKNQIEEKKVKISLTYKPRPVSNVEETYGFDPNSDFDSESKTQPNDSNIKGKTISFNEKSHKIEGIVSKLKDTMGSFTSNSEKENSREPNETVENPEFCKIQPLNRRASVDNVTSPGCESNSSINVKKDINDSLNKTEPSVNTSQEAICNKSSTSNLSVDFKTKIAESEINEINNKLKLSFSFILSHSIDRKRLTPTLASIYEKKNVFKDTAAPISNQCKTLRNNRKNKKKNQDNVKDKDPEFSGSKISIKSSTPIKTPEISAEKEVQKSLYISQSPIPKIDLSSFEHVFKESASIENSDKDKIGVNTENDNAMNNKCDDSKCEDKISVANDSVPNGITNGEVDTPNSQIALCHKLECKLSEVKPQKEETEDGDIKNMVVAEENQDYEEKIKRYEIKYAGGAIDEITCSNKSPNNKEEITVSSIVVNKTNVKEEVNKMDESYKDNCSQMLNTKISVKPTKKDHGIEIPKKDLSESINEISKEPRTKYPIDKTGNSEKRVLPQLSIPTKGELKRFPTPERTFTDKSPRTSVVEVSNKIPSTGAKGSTDFADCKNELEVINNSEKSIVPKSVVESILHDFDDSNSIGSDVVESDNSKNCLQEKGCELEKKIQGKRNKKDDRQSLDSLLNHENDINVKVLNKESKSELDRETICLPLEKGETNTVLLKESKAKNELVDRTHSIFDADSSVNNESQNRTSKLNGNDSIDYNMISDDLPPKLSAMSPPKRTIKPTRSLSKIKSKPCPLSKKSKSYISKHLPTAFNLSVDGHLIRRGFKKLRVTLIRADAVFGETVEKEISVVDESDLNISNSESVQPLENMTAGEEMERNSPKEDLTVYKEVSGRS